MWDFWMTDYNPQFHAHIVADCPFNTFNKGAPWSSTEEGKSSSSTGPGKNLCSSLHQKTEEGKSSTEEGKSSTDAGKDPMF